MLPKQKEIWRDIEGYEGLYQVSNLGRIKSLNYNRTKQNKVLVADTNIYGYKRITLCKDRKLKHYPVHRLVATAFIPNPENKSEVNHINGIKTDNCVENLEWCTRSENTKHAYLMNLIHVPSGESCYNAKLTNEQARKIREGYIPRDENYGMSALAKKYNVSYLTIYRIIHHKRYKDI